MLEEKLRASRSAKRSRPKVLRGTTRQMESPLGDLFVTINEDEAHRPFELFATLGKAGSIAMADAEAIGRLISLALRFGVPLNEVYRQLRGISSDKAIGFGQNQVLSVPDAVAQAIGAHLNEKAGVQEELGLGGGSTPAAPRPPVAEPPHSQDHLMEVCPDCQVPGSFVKDSGCTRCVTPGCGFSKC